MKKYIIILALLGFNIGYTQTLTPKQDLYNSLVTGSLSDMFNFLTYSRPVALLALSPDTSGVRNISAFYLLLKDIRTDYPYDYYIQFQMPSKTLKKSMNRYVQVIGFIWKIDDQLVWVVEINPHKIGAENRRGVKTGSYRRAKFDLLLKNSLFYDKKRSSIQRN